MESGTIKFFNPTKGFGFIKTEGNKEIFFHISGVKANTRDLQPDTEVNYNVGQGKKGEMAIDIDLA